MVLSYVNRPTGPSAPSSLLAVSSTLPALCIIAVALRVNVRIVQKMGIKADDWIMLPALALVIAMGVCGILGVENRVWGYLTSENATDSSTTFEGKLLEAFQYIQIGALALIKCGALAFYHRIFCGKGPRVLLHYMIIATYVAICLWTLAMLLLNTFQCGSHIDALWTGSDQFVLYCSVVAPYGQAFAITNFILDLWILFLPLPKIFTLHTTTARKIGIAGVFLLALIGLAASLARMVAYIQIDDLILDPEADYRLEDTLYIFWSNLEVGLCLLAVNLPSLWAYKSMVSPEKMLASIRSIISLSSLASRGSRASHSRNESARTATTPAASSTRASSSYVSLLPSVESGESFMADMKANDGTPAIPPRAILADSAMEQGYSRSSTARSGTETHDW